MAISMKPPGVPASPLMGAAVNCPKCGASIPITEALSQQVNHEYELKRQQLESSIAERERKLDEELSDRLQKERVDLTVTLRREIDAQKGIELTALQEQLTRKEKLIEESNQKQLELARQKADLEDKERALKAELQQQLELGKAKLDAELATRLEKEKAGIVAKLRQELDGQKKSELAALQELLATRNKQIEEASAKELQWLRQKAELEDQKRNLTLEVERQLAAERGKVADQARAAALEESRLKLAEKDKQADELRRQIETLQQKATQGSVQTQGEVLELDFESRLRAQFPFDDISPIATGQRGADVRQVVRTSAENVCGSILWEAKRTRNWSQQWIAKLKSDQRDEQAEIAVIVTQALPREIESFGCVEGIWVSDFASAFPLALALRQGLVGMAAIRQAEAGKQGKMEQMYSFLTSAEFRQRISAIVEAYCAMQKDLETERNAMERIWAKREKQLKLAIQSTYNLFGSVQGILGSSALPDVPALALPVGE
jgi:hypothetical protein